MKFILAACAALALIAVLWTLVVLNVRRHKSRRVGFREWVRNPNLRKKMGAAFADRDAAVARLKSLDPKKLVEMLLEDDFELAARALKVGGARVVPALVDALVDARFRTPTDPKKQEREHFFNRRSEPLKTVLECLVELAPAEAAVRVAPLVTDSNIDIRKNASLLIGIIGTDACVAPLAKACDDDDDYVRSYAMMGVLRAIEAGRATEKFRAGAFEAIRPLLTRPDMSVSGGASRCLIKLDRKRATEIMTSPQVLAVGVEGLQYTLRALREAEVSVPESQLLQLARALKPIATKYPHDYVLEEVILLLATINTKSAERIILEAETSEVGKVRQAAIHALLMRRGVTNPLAFVWDAEKERGWSGLTQPQRHIIAARRLIDEVENGGFSQYFVNSSGSTWKDALVGLEASGCAHDVQVVRAAIAHFGPSGPSEDDEQRGNQLSRLVKSKGDEVFSPLETLFYKNEGDREVLLLRYIMRHPIDFGGRESPCHADQTGN